MSNFDYVDNNIEKRRYWIYSQNLHKQKLKEIKKRQKSDTPFRSTSTSQNYKSTKKVRDTNIKKANEMLLQKLVQIAGRPVISTQNTTRYHQTPAPRRLSMSPAQKREAIRIERENSRLAKKITDPNTSFKIKKWSEDYRKTLKYKQLLAKPRLLTALDLPDTRSPPPPLSAEARPSDRTTPLGPKLSIDISE